MLKKITAAMLIFSLICLIGCSKKNDGATIDDFISAFNEAGISVSDKKPLYNLIGASDGIAFEHDDKVVIYVYKTEKELKKAKNDYEVTKDWPSNGRFLLETKNSNVIEIFNKVN